MARCRYAAESCLQSRVNALLDDAEKALVAKDRERFVRLTQTDSTRKELVRRYNNLLALRVTQFSYYVKAIQFDATAGQWK